MLGFDPHSLSAIVLLATRNDDFALGSVSLAGRERIVPSTNAVAMAHFCSADRLHPPSRNSAS